jgi:hypothetical protein
MSINNFQEAEEVSRGLMDMPEGQRYRALENLQIRDFEILDIHNTRMLHKQILYNLKTFVQVNQVGEGAETLATRILRSQPQQAPPEVQPPVEVIPPSQNLPVRMKKVPQKKKSGIWHFLTGR